MQRNNLTLESLISKETLNKSIKNIAFVFIALFIVAVFYVVYENNKSHNRSISNLATELDRVFENAQQQINNLANNDLIINSIVDYSNRDNYLPIFFRSLKLNKSAKTSIVFTDFSGEVITGKNLKRYQRVVDKFDWNNSVLEQGQSYFNYSRDGIFIASPVMLANLAEGAIVSYTENLQELVLIARSDLAVILIDENNEVLYSSASNLISQGANFSKNDFPFWFSQTKEYKSGRIISLEPPLYAYSNILWLAVIIFISLISIVLGLMSNVKRTARYASNSMFELQHTLASAIKGGKKQVEVNVKENDPTEFIAIRREFNAVLNNLFEQTISLEKFISVINSLEEMLLVLDDKQNIILTNHSLNAFGDKLGLSLPKQLNEVLSPEQIIEISNANSIEVIYCNKEDKHEKTKCIIQWYTSPYIDEHGNKQGTIYVGKDISNAKQLAMELLVKNKAIDNAQTSIIITDAKLPSNPIIYTNIAFTKLTGYQSEEIIGKSCRILQGPNTEQPKIEQIRAAIQQHSPITININNYKKDGSEFINELTLNPIFNEQEELSHYLGIQNDVTEREATARYLKLAKQKAEESTKLKSEFLASMSHEIRTPINGVIGMLDMMLRNELSTEQYQNAEVAKNSADSLLVIINDILDFSKIEAGKLEIEKAVFDLPSLFDNVIRSHAKQAQEKSLELILDITNIENSIVVGDAGRLRQILNNLISNSIKFTQDGSVVVKANIQHKKSCSSTLTCSISDTGIGIPQNRINQIFYSFTQADSSTTRLYGGTGLGLAISKELCQLMNGSISVKSKENIGSSFTFNIAVELPNEHISQPTITLDDLKFLIVDNELSAKVISKILRTCGGIAELHNDETNLETNLIKADYDVCIISSFYQGRSTTEIIEKLPIETKSSKKFILINQLIDEINLSTIKSAGFASVVTKPITSTNLKPCLEQVLNKVPLSSIELFSNNHKQVVPSHREKLNILLVEDNRTNQLVAKKVLSELNCEVVIANHGKEALETLTTNNTKFSLIFMDCQMPEMDGYEATIKIRQGAAGEAYKSTPIIAMTANAMQGDREKCLLHGMDDYVSKPIKIEILKGMLDRYC